jgi:hypothetical protein
MRISAELKRGGMGEGQIQKMNIERLFCCARWDWNMSRKRVKGICGCCFEQPSKRGDIWGKGRLQSDMRHVMGFN